MIRRVVLLVTPSTTARRSARVTTWIRALVPTALLVVAFAPLPPAGDGPPDTVTVRVDALAEAGPLSLAEELVRDYQANADAEDPDRRP